MAQLTNGLLSETSCLRIINRLIFLPEKSIMPMFSQQSMRNF